MDSPSEDSEEQTQQQQTESNGNDDQQVYFVPFRWWKEAQDTASADGKKGTLYTASPGPSYGGPMKIINNIFSSDVAFNLRKEDDPSLQTSDNGEVGVSGRDFALVPGDMWIQALKWHSGSKTPAKNSKSFSTSDDDMTDVYPLQLRLSGLQEGNSLGVRISKKVLLLGMNTGAKLRGCQYDTVQYNCVKSFRRLSQVLKKHKVVGSFNSRHLVMARCLTSLKFHRKENGGIGCNDSKDNAVESYKRACKIFIFETDPIRIWDFSGQTASFFSISNQSNDRDLKDSPRQLEQDMLLELQVYGLSDSVRNRAKKNEIGVQYSNGTSYLMNGSASLIRSPCETGTLGLTGLQNLGNTCFMNSAVQCLAHTPKLVDYFLGDYKSEINYDNPLGMNGEIASAFGDLLKQLWAPGATPVAPRTFKLKLSHFAPQFSGFSQHDSQELLAFLLDGLHEDLNRVKCKPYVEAKDGDGRPDEEVADEYWKNHRARNDSIIVDVCQGQYRSKLVCPVCRKVSITFDPFMYLSLPLPSTSMRSMTISVMKSYGDIQLSVVTVNVPKDGKYSDLINILSTACSLGADETLLVAEVYNSRIIRYLGGSADSLSLIRDGDRLVAYRLLKSSGEDPLVVFTHQQTEEHYISGKLTPGWKMFGIPFVASCRVENGCDLRNLYLRLLLPFIVHNEDFVGKSDKVENGATEVLAEIEATSPRLVGLSENTDAENIDAKLDSDFEFLLTDEKGMLSSSAIVMNEPLKFSDMPERLNVLVCWPDKMLEQYNRSAFSSLPEVFKSGFFTKRPQESVCFYKCLEAFLKEEPLGPEDMWYCPGCKEHRQATKKLDLWRLPEIMVIHMKRFSYNRFLKNKLETFVDFPIHDLELSSYIAHQDGQSSCRYMLYAISNHYGSMGGGHYTAFVRQGGEQWYDFDDSHVSPVNVEKIKTSAAYVLFYRRVEENHIEEMNKTIIRC
nr:ubiquitin carboxyl-terminal hydrolase 8 [Ipomoea batatas]